MTTTSAPTGAVISEDPAPFALNRAWRDAFNVDDLDLLMSMYEPDAVLVPGPDAQPISGHAAIAAALARFLSLGGRLEFTPRHWLVCGEIAFGSIEFLMTGAHDADGNAVPLTGVTNEVLRRQSDGTWKYVIDHPFGGTA